MVMTSGVVPYQYDTDVPLRSDRQSPIAHSGIFLEQGMFVLNAERRRYKGEIDNDDFDWRLWTSIDGVNRGFEPTGSGFWMGSPLSPVGPLPGIVLNPILDLRKNLMLHLLEDGFAEDSDYLPERFRRDWLHNAYPNSPSGFNEITAEDNCSGDGAYFRRAPLHPGEQLSTDIGVLGTSGVLFDIDFGEIMYNPLPRIGRSLFADQNSLAHKALDEFLFNNNTSIAISPGIPIPVSPVFPAFQTTTGSVVTTTSRDIKNNQSNYWSINSTEVRSQLPFNTLHVESGVFQLDGDVLRHDSKYYFGTGGTNAEEDFLPVGEFAFSQSGIRAIGRPVHLNFDFGTKIPSGQNSNISRVYLDPAGTSDDPITSGVYHIAVANSGTNVPHSAAASGTVSHWPSGNPGPTAPGFHVFDDCIWVRDQSANLNASGMAIISPHDGTAMWLRNASLDNMSLFGNLAVSQSALAFNRLNFPGMIGMARIAQGRIITIYPVASVNGIDSTVPAAGDPADENYKIYAPEFDDLLDLTQTNESSVQTQNSMTPNINVPFGDIIFDGSRYWVTKADGTAVNELSSVFVLVQDYDQTGTDVVRRIFYDGSTYWAYAEDSGSKGNLGGFQPITFAASTFSLGTAKIIDASPLPLGPNATLTVVDSIHHVISTSNGIHVTNGNWALVRTQDENLMGVISNQERMWLLRITEGVTTFDIEEFNEVYIPEKKAQPALNGNPSYYDIVHMPVNPGLF